MLCPVLCCRVAMYKHDDVAGDWARNSKDQIVAAWDPKRAIKGATYKYFCHCPCRQPLTFRAGEVKRPHFAYKANRKTGCTGGNSGPETKLHYDTKWFLHDNFSKINFWRRCHMGHRVSKNQFSALQWTAIVEKKIPGTGRIADVLLTNRITDEAVALEVLKSHAVGENKKNECDLAGVSIIEINANNMDINSLDWNNELDQYDCEDCVECVRIEKEEQKMEQARRARRAIEIEEEHRRNICLENERLLQKELHKKVDEAINILRRKREEAKNIEKAKIEENERLKKMVRDEAERLKKMVRDEATRVARIQFEAEQKVKQEQNDKFLQFQKQQRLRAEAARKFGAIEDLKRANAKAEQESLYERHVKAKQSL